MWDQLLPRPLARAGRLLETRLAPPLYRRTAVVTPSDGTRDELLELGFRPHRVTAVPNGVDPFFTPGVEKSSAPLVVGVGRMAPVKRFGLLLDALLQTKRRVPELQVVLAGDGPERAVLLRRVAETRATDWVALPGHVTQAEVRDLVRSAWVVASASLAEGWGLVLTEAAACGTPAVASDIRGHRSSVVDGVTGLLAPADRLADPLVRVLTEPALREALGRAARARAATLTWDASAAGITEVLLDEVRRHR
jgi:glycosyltransferase involved in cell wall biosynthesis